MIWNIDPQTFKHYFNNQYHVLEAQGRLNRKKLGKFIYMEMGYWFIIIDFLYILLDHYWLFLNLNY